MTLFYLALLAGAAYVVGFACGLHAARRPGDEPPVIVIDDPRKGLRR